MRPSTLIGIRVSFSCAHKICQTCWHCGSVMCLKWFYQPSNELLVVGLPSITRLHWFHESMGKSGGDVMAHCPYLALVTLDMGLVNHSNIGVSRLSLKLLFNICKAAGTIGAGKKLIHVSNIKRRGYRCCMFWPGRSAAVVFIFPCQLSKVKKASLQPGGRSKYCRTVVDSLLEVDGHICQIRVESNEPMVIPLLVISTSVHMNPIFSLSCKV